MQNGQIFFHKMIQNQNGLKIFEHIKYSSVQQLINRKIVLINKKQITKHIKT